MLASSVSVPRAARPGAAALRSRCNAVPAQQGRRRGMRLSPLDPFFGMEFVRPLFESEAAAGNLASSTRHMAIDIVEVCALETTACV